MMYREHISEPYPAQMALDYPHAQKSLPEVTGVMHMLDLVKYAIRDVESKMEKFCSLCNIKANPAVYPCTPEFTENHFKLCAQVLENQLKMIPKLTRELNKSIEPLLSKIAEHTGEN